MPMMKLIIYRNNILLLILILISVGLPCLSYAQANSAEHDSNPFSHSDIAIMYNEEDMNQLKKYNVDHISWGSQIHPFPGAIERQLNIFRNFNAYGLKLFSVDIALIQEGGLYTVCEDKWDADCNKLFYQLRKNNRKALQKILSKGI